MRNRTLEFEIRMAQRPKVTGEETMSLSEYMWKSALGEKQKAHGAWKKGKAIEGV